MQTTKDLYKLLGVSREASQDDIRKAHRKLVRKYHPDANPTDRSAEERFKEVQRAYEVLSDPQKRRDYDKGLRTSSPRGSSGSRTRPRGAARRSRGDTTSTVDLSNLLGKLANLSSRRVDGRKEDGFQLRGEDIARLAKHLGVDATSLSKFLREHIKVNAKVSFGEAQSGIFPTIEEEVSGSKQSGVSNKAKEKKVKGPSAQRNRKND